MALGGREHRATFEDELTLDLEHSVQSKSLSYMVSHTLLIPTSSPFYWTEMICKPPGVGGVVVGGGGEPAGV